VKSLILPDHLKSKLKVPHGILYEGCGHETMRLLKNELNSNNPTRIISVGDITTYTLIEADILPDICIVDHLTCRARISDDVLKRIHHPVYLEVSVENPAGSITSDLILCIKKAVRSGNPTLIFVQGEEDLAVMPAVIFAPTSSIVIYGQPSSGCVLINVTSEKKKEILELLKQMEDFDDDIRRILNED